MDFKTGLRLYERLASLQLWCARINSKHGANLFLAINYSEVFGQFGRDMEWTHSIQKGDVSNFLM